MPDSDFIKSELDMGTSQEMEHTDDKDIAKQIAKAHLYEDSKYYTKYKEFEKSLKEKSK